MQRRTYPSTAKYHGIPGKIKNQCEAAKKHTGERCGQRAELGGNVCRYHGARAPQVKESNRLRLAQLVSPSLAKLEQIVRAAKNDQYIPATVQKAAAVEILHMNGYKAKDEVVVTQEFDPTEFSAMSDEEIAQFIALGRKLTAAQDARDTPDADQTTD